MTPVADARPMGPADLAAWNRALNRTHAMAGLRARGGRLVRAVEARRRGLVARAVRRLAPRRAVDAGTEDGWVAEAWADGLEALRLVDIDPDVLARSALARRPGVEVVVADATDGEALLRAVGRCWADVVVLSALLEHLPEPARALSAFAPCLRPGGAFVVYVPADRPILFLKRLLRGTRLGGLVRGLSLAPAPGHLHVYDRRRLRALLAPHGRLEALAFDPLALGYLAVVRTEG